MFTKYFSGTISIIFITAALLGAGLITLPAMQTVQGAVNITPTFTKTNTCGLIVVPVVCTNNLSNEVIVTPTPVPTQNIDVTGTQNIDQTNTCDDDDLGIPGEIECLNDSFGNIFVLEHSQTADMTVQSFDQDIHNANDCFVFDQCDNFGGNGFIILDDGILGTDADINVGSSSQDIDQLNDCDGSVGDVEPDPVCSNFRSNNLILGQFLQVAPEDGIIELGENFQSAHQENVCEKGNVECNNFGGSDSNNVITKTRLQSESGY